MAKTSAVKITAADVLRLVDEWDNITARLWRPGFPYQQEHFERPEFREYVARRTNGFAAMAESVRSLNVSRKRGNRARKNLVSLAKPSEQDLVAYARGFDRGRLLTVLKELSRAAVAWDIDPGPFIELRGAVLVVLAGGATETEPDSVKNPAWTTARVLQMVAESKLDKPIPARNDEPTDDEFAKGKALYDAGIATKRDQIADKLGVGDRKAGNILAKIKGKRRRSPRSK